MNKIDDNALQKLYIAYFGRPGDPLGLKYWLSPSNELLTLREISNQLDKEINGVCEECREFNESVQANLIMHGYKICNSCKTSKTIFPL